MQILQSRKKQKIARRLNYYFGIWGIEYILLTNLAKVFKLRLSFCKPGQSQLPPFHSGDAVASVSFLYFSLTGLDMRKSWVRPPLGVQPFFMIFLSAYCFALNLLKVFFRPGGLSCLVGKGIISRYHKHRLDLRLWLDASRASSMLNCVFKQDSKAEQDTSTPDNLY
jgi:hypothetical protein